MISVQQAVNYYGKGALEVKYAERFPDRHYFDYECAARYEKLFDTECKTESELEDAKRHCGLYFDLLSIKKKRLTNLPLDEGEEMLLLVMRTVKANHGSH